MLDVKRVFPEFNQDFERNPQHGFSSTNTSARLISDFAEVEEGTVAGKYLVRPLECGIHKSLSIIFASLFILSNLVRYKPSFWMKEMEGQHSGSASIVEVLCNLAVRRLPNDILESIWWEKFEYGTPARLV